ncbi:uncharacterized protein LOC123508632 isoform X3 [Portunus trituberculatus]|nr:uncharacterized protein LOC123508632 isoform X3 [Portunus trituberculatus]
MRGVAVLVVVVACMVSDCSASSIKTTRQEATSKTSYGAKLYTHTNDEYKNSLQGSENVEAGKENEITEEQPPQSDETQNSAALFGMGSSTTTESPHKCTAKYPEGGAMYPIYDSSFLNLFGITTPGNNIDTIDEYKNTNVKITEKTDQLKTDTGRKCIGGNIQCKIDDTEKKGGDKMKIVVNNMGSNNTSIAITQLLQRVKELSKECNKTHPSCRLCQSCFESKLKNDPALEKVLQLLKDVCEKTCCRPSIPDQPVPVSPLVFPPIPNQLPQPIPEPIPGQEIEPNIPEQPVPVSPLIFPSIPKQVPQPNPEPIPGQEIEPNIPGQAVPSQPLPAGVYPAIVFLPIIPTQTPENPSPSQVNVSIPENTYLPPNPIPDLIPNIDSLEPTSNLNRPYIPDIPNPALPSPIQEVSYPQPLTPSSANQLPIPDPENLFPIPEVSYPQPLTSSSTNPLPIPDPENLFPVPDVSYPQPLTPSSANQLPIPDLENLFPIPEVSYPQPLTSSSTNPLPIPDPENLFPVPDVSYPQPLTSSSTNQLPIPNPENVCPIPESFNKEPFPDQTISHIIPDQAFSQTNQEPSFQPISGQTPSFQYIPDKQNSQDILEPAFQYIPGQHDSQSTSFQNIPGQSSQSTSFQYIPGQSSQSTTFQYIPGQKDSQSTSFQYIPGQSSQSTSFQYIPGQKDSQSTSFQYIPGQKDSQSTSFQYIPGQSSQSTSFQNVQGQQNSNSQSTSFQYIPSQTDSQSTSFQYIPGKTDSQSTSFQYIPGQTDSQSTSFQYIPGQKYSQSSLFQYIPGRKDSQSTSFQNIKSQQDSKSSSFQYIPGQNSQSTSFQNVQGQQDSKSTSFQYIPGQQDSSSQSTSFQYIPGQTDSQSTSFQYIPGQSSQSTSFQYIPGQTDSQSTSFQYIPGQTDSQSTSFQYIPGKTDSQSTSFQYIPGQSSQSTSFLNVQGQQDSKSTSFQSIPGQSDSQSTSFQYIPGQQDSSLQSTSFQYIPGQQDSQFTSSQNVQGQQDSKSTSFQNNPGQQNSHSTSFQYIPGQQNSQSSQKLSFQDIPFQTESFQYIPGQQNSQSIPEQTEDILALPPNPTFSNQPIPEPAFQYIPIKEISQFPPNLTSSYQPIPVLFSGVLSQCGKIVIEGNKPSFSIREKLEKFPSFVKIFKKYRMELLCGGTLIHPSLVLTAAHCITSTARLRVHLGGWDVTGVLAQERDVAAIAIHHQYDRETLKHDIALLHLNRPAVLTPSVGPLCLGPVVRATKCLSVSLDNLETMETPVWKKERCWSKLINIHVNGQVLYHSSFLCTNSLLASTSNTPPSAITPSNKSSGSPLLCQDPRDGTYWQAGVMAFDIPSRNTAVFVSVMKQQEWILNTAQHLLTPQSW